MASATWKRVEKSAGYQRKKLFLKWLLGKELRYRPEVKVHKIRYGGWWLHLDILDRNSVVYSVGIGEDTAFDEALLESVGLELHAFDPTPSTVDYLAAREGPPNFHFHPWAVAGNDGVLRLFPRVRRDGSHSTVIYTVVQEGESSRSAIEVPALTLTTIVAKLGHEYVDLIKVDIEGAEYDVLDHLLASTLRPAQLLVEFHHRFPGIGMGRTADTVARLRSAGYRIFAVSETGRELSFLRFPG